MTNDLHDRLMADLLSEPSPGNHKIDVIVKIDGLPMARIFQWNSLLIALRTFMAMDPDNMEFMFLKNTGRKPPSINDTLF